MGAFFSKHGLYWCFLAYFCPQSFSLSADVPQKCLFWACFAPKKPFLVLLGGFLPLNSFLYILKVPRLVLLRAFPPPKCPFLCFWGAFLPHKCLFWPLLPQTGLPWCFFVAVVPFFVQSHPQNRLFFCLSTQTNALLCFPSQADVAAASEDTKRERGAAGPPYPSFPLINYLLIARINYHGPALLLSQGCTGSTGS